MSRCLTRRAAVLFVLSVLLAAPWSIAEPREGRGAAPPVSIWSWLMSEIGCIADPHGGCEKIDIGCIIDPGGCGQVDIGCVADPGGLCRDTAESQVDIGCGIDPHGGCGPGPSQADIGCGADPHGGCGQ